MKDCPICRNEFPAATTETQHPRHGQFENMNEDEAK